MEYLNRNEKIIYSLQLCISRCFKKPSFAQENVTHLVQQRELGWDVRVDTTEDRLQLASG